MPESDDRAVFTFTTTHQAMAAEDILREAGLRLEVVPPPRELSAGCGLALKIQLADVQAAREALTREGGEYDALHRLGAGQKVLERLD